MKRSLFQIDAIQNVKRWRRSRMPAGITWMKSRIGGRSKRERSFLYDNCDRHIASRIFQLKLPIATVVTDIVNYRTISQAICAWHLFVHVALHATMFMHLHGRLLDIHRISHRAGLQGEVQPHSHKQAKGVLAPRSLLSSDAGQITQVTVSTRILGISRIPSKQSIGNSTYASRAQITPSSGLRPFLVRGSHHVMRVININSRVRIARHTRKNMARQALEVHDEPPQFSCVHSYTIAQFLLL